MFSRLTVHGSPLNGIAAMLQHNVQCTQQQIRQDHDTFLDIEAGNVAWREMDVTSTSAPQRFLRVLFWLTIIHTDYDPIIAVRSAAKNP
jgi:hypothetical protein